MSHGNYKGNYSSQETHKIKQVQFCVLSEQDISKNSVCEVTSMLLYDKETGLPAGNGLNDPRMGISIRGLVCQTCFGDIKQCPGHFGHLKLAEIVFHVEFLEIVHKILKCICFHCSRLLVSSEKLSSIKNIKNPKKRLKEMVSSSSRICAMGENGAEGGCGRVQPSYLRKKLEIMVRASGVNASSFDGEDSKRSLRASEVYEVFKAIDENSIELLGLNPEFSRPENFLIRLLIVAPPAVRPSIELSSSARSEDDLTHLYQSILSTNIELIKAKESGLPRTKVDEIILRLQSYVAYLMNNNENKAKQKGGRPIKAISQRLKGKEGRLRGNLMGKRVDFSARTVVSPDPSLELDQLGVPVQIASEMTIPETVTQLNIDFLRSLVERGDEWPGARYYISKVRNNEVVDLNFVKTKPNLQYGDIVERHLMDGDFVLFNRQPSLHKMSIMGHRVKVLPFSTFRLNLAVTTPYNADFDGDEMNMHVPQSLETKAEIKHIMHVPRQIVTPQSNRPVMGLNQDALLAIRLFTLRSALLNRDELIDLLMQIEDWDGIIPKPAILKPQAMWTGKQILSMIIPMMDYRRGPDLVVKDFYNEDSTVIIKRGELVAGTITKSVVGPTNGSLMGCIWIDFGPDRTKDFYTYSQRIVNSWLVRNGFTVGIADTIISVALLQDIEKKRIDAQRSFLDVLQDTQKENKKLIIHQPGKTIIQSFEHKVNTILNDCRAEIGKLLNENIGSSNNIKRMILAGSKGNNINISQISGLVGQQNVEGARIKFGFYRRTLPHFLKDDFGPESRGFVANSYYKGLTPEEFFFHTMGGREGLIDTAVKTSQTGYMQRRLVKALEDVMIQYDQTVRDSQGNLIQYLYGEDGINAEYIEDQKFELLDLSDSQFSFRCCFFKVDESKADLGFERYVLNACDNGYISHSIRDLLVSNKNSHEILLQEYNDLLKYRKFLRETTKPGESPSTLPVNIERLISYAQIRTGSRVNQYVDPITVIEQRNEMLSRLSVLFTNHSDSNIESFAKEQNERALYLFKALVSYKLCSRRVVFDLKLTTDSFKYLISEIELCFNRARVHPGEMTGSIAAQSIGETLTQMTLNTFHFAGVSSQNITLGVPRIQEIINCSKNIKGQSMTIYLADEHRFSPESAHRLISQLEFTTLSHLAKVSEIYFDPNPSTTVIPEDQDLIFMEEENGETMSPWILRLLIDPVLLGRKGIRLKDIVQRIESYLPSSVLKITESLETASPVILRLRLISRSENDYNDIKKIEQFILEDMPIKGFCKKVSYRRQKVKIFGPSGIETNGSSEGEFVLETSGTDIRRVLGLNLVNKSRTTTNDLFDIYATFGIEAARNSLLREIRIVFEFFNIYVNYRHISLLADTITSTGKLMSISRNGINRVYTSPFRKCSFEETVDILMEAAIFAETDSLKGVTENVMVGQLSKMGTGCFDVLMDPVFLLPSEKDKDKVAAQWKYFPDLHPILEAEFDFSSDNSNNNNLSTPYLNPNTPIPGTQYHSRQTPTYDAFGGNLSPYPMTPRGAGYGNELNNMPLSPGGRMSSPGIGGGYGYGMIKTEHINDYNQVMSPMLMGRDKIVSPGIYNGGIMNSGSDLKYSPLSPHYGTSPIGGFENKTNRYGVTDSSNVKNLSSPFYSPISYLSPMSQDNHSIIGSALHNNNGPIGENYDDIMKNIYNYGSPGYKEFKEEEIKEEEKQEEDI